MAFDDDALRDHPWTWGSLALLAAGFAQMATIALQMVMLVGFGGAFAMEADRIDPVLVIVLGGWFLAPNVGTLFAAAMLFLGARRLRFLGPGPVVWLGLATGVFWPVIRMGLSMLACNVFEAPIHVLGALATLVALVVVALDPETRQLFPPKKAASAGSDASPAPSTEGG